MNIAKIMSRNREVLTARSVYTKPYERNGVAVIPAARVTGGMGGGGGENPEKKGSETGGTGVGVVSRPVGAYIVRGEEVRWKPSLDLTRILLQAQVLAALLWLAHELLTWRR